MEEKCDKKTLALFMAYCAVMLWLLFDRSRAIDGMGYWEQVSISLNLHPLHTVRLYIRLLGSKRPQLVKLAVINLIGNVVMFVPLGFFLPQIFRQLRKLWRTLLTVAGIIVLVELTQLFTLVGSCDVDDLILNVFGASLGYGLYKLAKRRNRNP